MSSTRRAENDGVLRQNKFASSPEFERGLVAYLVAKRGTVLDDRADRKLIWFLQFLSHEDGGLAAVVKDLLVLYGDRVRTAAMREAGIKPGMICDAGMVRTMRAGLNHVMKAVFILKGELFDGFRFVRIEICQSETDKELTAQSLRHPDSYPADKFFECCRLAAGESLENEIRELCLNPAYELKGGPWYFPSLVESLREYHAHWVKVRAAGVFTTELGRKVSEALDYTQESGGLTLVEGGARLGKTFSAQAWCYLNPGRARFVEVPTGNDDAGFFYALARGLGLGSFLSFKLTQIKARIEAVLREGDLLLVLDEAHRLFPQLNSRYGFPSRINWVMSMVNDKVPICAIATPQFIEYQKAAEEKHRWNSAQLIGRIGFYDELPKTLSLDDLMGVAQSVLPEADERTLKALAAYAQTSARYLAAIDTVVKRARYNVRHEGRQQVTAADVRKAMQDSVIPSDKGLVQALERVNKPKRVRISPPTPQMPSGSVSTPEAMDTIPAQRGGLAGPAQRREAGNLMEFNQG